MNILKFIKAISASAVVSVAVSTIVAGGITTFMNHQSQVRIQENMAKIQKVLEFAAGGDSFVAAGGEFINAMGRGRDTSGIGTSLRSEIIKQIGAAQDLRVIFQASYEPMIEAYEHALQKFAGTLPKARSETEMREYVEAFGVALDRRMALKQALIKAVGVGS